MGTLGQRPYRDGRKPTEPANRGLGAGVGNGLDGMITVRRREAGKHVQDSRTAA
jgi:hypothetical protein